MSENAPPTSKFGRFLFLHKVIVFNVLLTAFILAVPPRVFNFVQEKTNLHFYLGVAMLAGLFFEFAGLHYKTNFLYAERDTDDYKISGWFMAALLPRMVISVGLCLLAFRGMGWLDVSDFVLIPAVMYGVSKEFRVKNTLLNPEFDPGKRVGKSQVWMGEAFILIFACLAYFCLWEFYLLEAPNILRLMHNPINYAFFGLTFAFFVVMIEVPYLLEEYLRAKRKKHTYYALLSLLLPVGGFVFDIFRVGFNF